MQRKSLKMSCRAWWVAPAQWRQVGEDQRGGIWGWFFFIKINKWRTEKGGRRKESKKEELLFACHRASKKQFLAQWHRFRGLTRLEPPASTVHSTHPSVHSQPGARRSALSGPPCRSQRASVQRSSRLQFVFLWNAARVVLFVYSSWWPLYVSQLTLTRQKRPCRTDRPRVGWPAGGVAGWTCTSACFAGFVQIWRNVVWLHNRCYWMKTPHSAKRPMIWTPVPIWLGNSSLLLSFRFVVFFACLFLFSESRQIIFPDNWRARLVQLWSADRNSYLQKYIFFHLAYVMY